MRKLANSNKPIQEITIENGVTTVKTVLPLRCTEIKFEIGKEFEETTGDDKTIKVCELLFSSVLLTCCLSSTVNCCEGV